MPAKRRQRNFQGRDFRKKRCFDRLSQSKRSNLMGLIRSSGSKMERTFVAALRSQLSIPFAVNDSTVFGKPDVVFRFDRVCIFLDSDFWHGWQYPRWKHLLKTDFWRRKIEINRRRDATVTRKLRRQGWTVIRLWEHNLIRDVDKAFNLVFSALSAKPKLNTPRVHDGFRGPARRAKAAVTGRQHDAGERP
jgi:DNA mismatch endonuclease (patch repair protein)